MSKLSNNLINSLNFLPTDRTVVLPKDCYEALNNGGRQSGIQRIQPFSSSAPFFVQCDMETRGGGWTV